MGGRGDQRRERGSKANQWRRRVARWKAKTKRHGRETTDLEWMKAGEERARFHTGGNGSEGGDVGEGEVEEALLCHRRGPPSLARRRRRDAMAMATVSLLRFTPHRSITTIAMSRRDGNTVPATEGLLSAASYALPFLNALHYGHFLYAHLPPVATAMSPILPFAATYHSVLYAAFFAFFAFFAIYIFMVRNPSMSRYIRYNAMQAVVLDVILAVLVLAQRMLGTPKCEHTIAFPTKPTLDLVMAPTQRSWRLRWGSAGSTASMRHRGRHP